jgi:hypothetical protein
MRTLIAVLTVTLALAAASGGRAEAQMIGSGLPGGPRVFTGPGGAVALTPGSAQPSAAPASGYNGVGTYSLPYSYYAAIPPMPARIYVDYGDSGFPFYGKPYGHVYDRWSWSSMSDSSQGVLARYYYPPVR